ncbi:MULTISPECIES: mycofactocin precursor MftA [Streptomyces]|jgi:mycofactocin precursor|uniref:Mycofactocin MftA n=1 Tax=Streptomyces sp. 900129855 TaxID=3155129 RepID=A0ABV2ZF09_9ACTN
MAETSPPNAAGPASGPDAERTPQIAPEDQEPLTDPLIEDISIDGMCGVY